MIVIEIGLCLLSCREQGKISITIYGKQAYPSVTGYFVQTWLYLQVLPPGGKDWQYLQWTSPSFSASATYIVRFVFH